MLRILIATLFVSAPLLCGVGTALAQSTAPQTDRPSDNSGGHECESKKKEQVTS